MQVLINFDSGKIIHLKNIEEVHMFFSSLRDLSEASKFYSNSDATIGRHVLTAQEVREACLRFVDHHSTRLDGLRSPYGVTWTSDKTWLSTTTSSNVHGLVLRPYTSTSVNTTGT